MLRRGRSTETVGSAGRRRQKKKHEPQQRVIEAFANHFIGFIRAQTEDSSKLAPPKCDTPRKVPGGAGGGEGEPIAQRKSSIIGGSDYPAPSGVPDTHSTPLADCRSPVAEPDTTGSPGGHLIARQLFGHAPAPSGGGVGGPNIPAFPIMDDEEVPSVAATGTTPKWGSHQVINGHSSPHGQSVARCHRSAGDGAIYFTPPRAGNGSRNASHMLLSVTSTPIQSGGFAHRGKPTHTPQYGSSRNGSGGLEVSHPSSAAAAAAANGSQRYESLCGVDGSGGVSDGGGTQNRRNKTNSPCLGDFIVTTRSAARSQKSQRRSPLTSSGHHTSHDGSTATQNNNSSSIFQNNDFPQLSFASATSTPTKDTGVTNEDARGQKKRAPIQLPETPTGVTGGKKEVQRRRIAPTTVSRTVSGRHDFTSSSFKSDNNLVSIESADEGGQDPRGMLRRLKDEIRTDFEAEQAQMARFVRVKQSLQSSFGQMEAIGALGECGASDDAAGPEQNPAAEGGARAVVTTIDFRLVTQQPTIDRLVAIYALLMDLNLVPNVLNELAYLINLVSTERVVQTPSEPTASGGGALPPTTDLASVLHSPHNCVYFATEVLYRQRLLLALLDSTSLRVVVENEQLGALQPTLNGFLREALAQKMKLENGCSVQQQQQQAGLGSDPLANSSITNVFYQQENDTKDHFPSVKEFVAFNKQRDSFYTILRIWESEHLNPSWEFEAKLGPKVRAMLDILHHPINMAHLAKLFSAQLIISFNFDNSASELQLALPSIDLTKLSKLRQRLVAPSIFSTQYLFPGSQTFFRDFIAASENHPIFTEQLKAVLVHELLQMNGSSYDIFSIVDAQQNKTHRTEYVVRPETIATMRVLAKFVGFIIARPFQYEGCRSTIVENRQIELRNTLLPVFDVKPILLRSVVDRKLVITVPWLVQYLSMLDAVTLRLRYYEELFHLLHDVYQATAMCGLSASRHLFVVPTSKFIVRSCLDWLFDQPNVPEEYFNSCEPPAGHDHPGTGPVHIEQLAAERFGVFSEQQHVGETLPPNVAGGTAVANRASVPGDTGKQIAAGIVFNPLLEAILSAACPFLADFRVAVMPSKVEKALSRTGRYRHITTRFSGAVTPSPATPGSNVVDASFTMDASANHTPAAHNHSKSGPANVQNRLVEAFLQSQSLSLRRTVEFVMERATSAVIKDFQMTFLLPAKKAASDRIAAVGGGSTVHDVSQRIYDICNEELCRINGTWESHVPKMLNKRITDSLDALLPAETIDAVRMTCNNIALEKCLQKTTEWRQSYMSDIELFCRNVQTEAESIMKSQHYRQQQQQQQSNKAPPPTSDGNQATVLTISVHSATSPSVLYGKLQLLVYHAAARPELLSLGELAEFLVHTLAFLDDPGLTMTTAMNRMLAYMLLQLFLLLIQSRCDLCVPELAQAAVRVWKHPTMAKHCSPPVAEPEETPEFPGAPSHERSFGYPADIEQFRRKKKQQDINYIFSHLISNRIIRMLETKPTPHQHYDSYAEFITVLLDAELITINLLNDQFVAIFNEEWSKPTLERISIVINRVLHKSDNSKRTGSTNFDDSHSEMFMALLSDLARDITEF